MYPSFARTGPVAVVCVALGTGCGGDDLGDCALLLDDSTDEFAIQTALINAAADSTVCLAAGTYAFRGELSIAQPGLTLRGAARDETVLDFAHQDLGGNGLQITSNDVTIQALTVRDTPGDGIRATAVSNVAFLDVAVRWTEPQSLANGAYGLYPVSSDGVRIENTVVVGSRDAGIYVGQSTNILVANSEAFGNVAGIEIENSTDVEVRDNYAHDNAAGILIFNLPDLPVQDGKRTNVHDNLVENNNIDNFSEPGTVVSMVPPGVGILVLASDDNEIHHNTVRGNVTLGLLFLSYVDTLFGPIGDPSYDVFPEGNYGHHNVFSDNGTDPQGMAKSIVSKTPAPDLMWDGCFNEAAGIEGVRWNCFSDNGAASYLNFDFCGLTGETDDIAPVTCSYPSLPGQNP